MWTLPDRNAVDALLDAASGLPQGLSEKLSAPLAMCLPDEWEDAKHRLMIVGQETLGWDYYWSDEDFTGYLLDGLERKDRVDGLANTYAWFDFAEPHASSRNGPFWRAHRHFASKLEDGNYRRVIWTNLGRCNTTGPEAGASVWNNLTYDELDALCDWQRPLLEAEIASSDAQAIVFFTGPNYDYLLRRTFPDIESEPVFDDVPARKAARLISKSLPNKTYRLYHPAYLRRSGQWDHIEKITNLI